MFSEVVKIYSNFAYYYDRLMKDIDYGKWADYTVELFKKYGIEPSLVLDLGCGTGSFCIEMSAKGYEMIGVDLSPDMLSCARMKSIKKGADILFLNQDMISFELYGTVDAAVCLMDSMNYITRRKDVEKVLKLVNNYLNPNGLFIFDINSQYKFENILADNVFYSVEDDISYIWQNSFDKTKSLCRFDLTFFVKSGRLYERFDEMHYEKAFTVDKLKLSIEAAGLELCAVYGEFGFSFPGKTCERIFFVCRKYNNKLNG
jgi:SAM-dependent methyltransferase